MAIIDRLREPSSWAAIATLLTLAGVHVAPETWTSVVAVGGGLASLAGVFLSERKS